MMDATVLITVGPQECYRRFLAEAIDSVLQQTEKPKEILLVADGEGFAPEDYLPYDYHYVGENFEKVVYFSSASFPTVTYWATPWNIGFAQAYNCGVGLALHDNIFFLGADDRMMSTCVEDCHREYEKNNHKDAWYTCSYQIGEDIHTIPNNCGMVTKNLWKWLGGFPPAAFAGPDAAMLSILMVHAKDRIIWVEDGKANYWIREHEEQETKRTAWPYSVEMTSIRTKLTDNFKPKEGIVLR